MVSAVSRRRSAQITHASQQLDQARCSQQRDVLRSIKRAALVLISLLLVFLLRERERLCVDQASACLLAPLNAAARWRSLLPATHARPNASAGSGSKWLKSREITGCLPGPSERASVDIRLARSLVCSRRPGRCEPFCKQATTASKTATTTTSTEHFVLLNSLLWFGLVLASRQHQQETLAPTLALSNASQRQVSLASFAESATTTLTTDGKSVVAVASRQRVSE